MAREGSRVVAISRDCHDEAGDEEVGSEAGGDLRLRQAHPCPDCGSVEVVMSRDNPRQVPTQPGLLRRIRPEFAPKASRCRFADIRIGDLLGEMGVAR